MINIGRDKAIEMYESGWWEGLDSKRIATVGLTIAELCLPFSVLHKEVEAALERPVWTHEFAGADLLAELNGEQPAPTFDEIMAMLPPDKTIRVEI